MEAQQCTATIYKADTYRRTGGKAHFKMHYVSQQCSRKATDGKYCWQHQWMKIRDR